VVSTGGTAHPSRWGARAVVVVRLAALVGTAAAAATAVGALTWSAGSQAARSLAAPGPAQVQDAVVLAAAAAVGALLTWCLAGAATALAAALLRSLGQPSRALDRASTRLAPPLVRRLAAAAVGIGVLGSLAAPASARAPARPPAAAVVTGTAPAVAEQVGVVPPWPSEGEPWSAPAPPAPAAAPTLPGAEGVRRLPPGDEGDVVVHRGDTLWSIAARALPAGATATQVAMEWPRWWAANRDVIGDDPDRLLPGQLLRAPGAGR
jgi:resuscitation-promoting factor RpfA